MKTIKTRTTKAHEARLRRAAARQGLSVQKQRGRYLAPYTEQYGRYLLVTADTNTLVGGANTLDGLEEWLNSPWPEGGGS